MATNTVWRLNLLQLEILLVMWWNIVAKINYCSVIADHRLLDECTVSKVPRAQYAVIFTLQ